MIIILKIAWRNIWRHKSKSLIVGTILFIGSTIMTVGMGIITGMNKGMEKNIVQNFTGDLVLVSKKQQSDNVFFSTMGQAVEILPHYWKVKDFLKTNDLVQSFLPIGKNLSMILNEEDGPMGGAFIIGIDINQYNNFFPKNLTLLQGAHLKSAGNGVIITPKSQTELATAMGLLFMPESCSVDTAIMPDKIKIMHQDIIVKQSMVFMGLNNNNTSTDIRQPIRGLVKYNALNSLFGSFIIMDIESYRHCLGYIAAAYQTLTIPKEHEKLLDIDNDNLEELFSESSYLIDSIDNNSIDSKSLQFKSSSIKNMNEFNLDSGTYNLVLVKLKKGTNRDEALQSIKVQLNDAHLGVRPIIWHKAIGTIGSLAMIIKFSLFLFVTLLFFVALVIIVNTLSMAAMERTSEIGMMRAIGAHKSFISAMFIAETMSLSFLFGSIGIVFGWLLVTILEGLHLTSSNDMIQLIYGGDRFTPFLSAVDFILIMIQLSFVAFIAALYPMYIARNIAPLDAISRD